MTGHEFYGLAGFSTALLYLAIAALSWVQLRTESKVRQGDVFLADLLEGGAIEVGKSIKFDEVLLIGDAKGSAKIGKPYLAGASVWAVCASDSRTRCPRRC